MKCVVVLGSEDVIKCCCWNGMEKKTILINAVRMASASRVYIYITSLCFVTRVIERNDSACLHLSPPEYIYIYIKMQYLLETDNG
jgi:hypothetical protein